jgi:hypothetical protein
MDGLKLNAYSLLREQEKKLTTTDKINVGVALIELMHSKYDLPEDWRAMIISKWYGGKSLNSCTELCPNGVKCMANLAPGKKTCWTHSE